MRYTAATCDPSDFMEERYSLRQNLYETPRRTELFIVLTMYNVSFSLVSFIVQVDDTDGLVARRKMKFYSLVLCMVLLVILILMLRKYFVANFSISTENIQHLCSRSRSKTWGADGWKKGRFPSLQLYLDALTNNHPFLRMTSRRLCRFRWKS